MPVSSVTHTNTLTIQHAVISCRMSQRAKIITAFSILGYLGMQLYNAYQENKSLKAKNITDQERSDQMIMHMIVSIVLFAFVFFIMGLAVCLTEKKCCICCEVPEQEPSNLPLEVDRLLGSAVEDDQL
jgi:hypothetical protein